MDTMECITGIMVCITGIMVCIMGEVIEEEGMGAVVDENIILFLPLLWISLLVK
jgi:hypothetical protein